LPEIDAGLKKAEALKKEADDSAGNNRTLVYKLKARMDTLSITEKKLAELRLRLKEVASEESILKNLIAIFGKNGIQSMLIELAIPEIENEANRVLGKMTDNRMALKLELEKPKKTGGTAQTLDIKIGDDVGTRDYEMYSGGEAFRIDFALRIALAKLLANRSGAPLPTLIIDEGFGTQDSIGLEKVKEAINAIQDDFEIILVITHIDELKNAFNNRIEVSKTQEGSTVSIF
jgi:exonuclease SbcC